MSLNQEKILAWWRNATDKQGGDRAGLARLRHCGTVAEALLQPITIGLYRSAGGDGPSDLESVGLLGAVLSHVTNDDPGISIARAIGPDTPDDHGSARVKPIRFSALMTAREPDEMLIAFARLVDLIRGEINATDLIGSLLRWDDETRRRWAFDYWNGTVTIRHTTKEKEETP